MKSLTRILIISCIIGLFGGISIIASASAQSLLITSTPSPSPSITTSPIPSLTHLPSPTIVLSPTSGSIFRPLIVMQNYSSGIDIIQAGQEFNLNATFYNSGEMDAINLTVTFYRGDYLSPSKNGGVHSFPLLEDGQSINLTQPMLADNSFGGRTVVNSSVVITYMNENGASFEQNFTLTFAAASINPTLTTMPMPTSYRRPFVNVQNYETGIGLVEPAQAFTLNFAIANSGELTAQNVAITFEGNDFFPIQTTGVFNVPSLQAGAMLPISQPMLVNKDLGTKTIASTIIRINYNDQNGNNYEGKYTITFPTINVTQTPTPSITPTPKIRPQLLIFAYTSDVESLHPGDTFTLELHISNLGKMKANNVYMVIGGSGDSSSSTTNSTPLPSDTTSIDLSKFAPVNSANRIFLGDIPVQKAMQVKQKFIVNVNTEPGAQSLPFSFAYTDDEGNAAVESQNITLLVYSPIKIDISMVNPIPTFTVNEAAPFSIQVTNMGKKSILLGAVDVLCETAVIENNSGIVGILDSGGFFSADVKITSQKAGVQKVTVRIHYIDDFSKARTFRKELAILMLPPPTPIPMDENSQLQEQETFWDQIIKFLRGLFGLETAPPPQEPPMQEIPIEGLGGAQPIQSPISSNIEPPNSDTAAAPAKYTIIAGALLLILLGGGGSLWVAQKKQHKQKRKRRFEDSDFIP